MAEQRAASPAVLHRLRAAALVVEDARTQGDELLDCYAAEARQGDARGRRSARYSGSRNKRPISASWSSQAPGTEHVLLGPLEQQDGVAAHALGALAVDAAGVLGRIEV